MHNRKLDDETVLAIPDLLLAGLTWRETAAQLGLAPSGLANILSGRTYAHLQPALQKRLAGARKGLAKLPATRACTKCEKALPRTAEFFQPRKNSKIGFESICRSCKSVIARQRYVRTKLEVMRHYCGGEPACECCKETEIEFLSIDHIDGGGHRHRKEFRPAFSSIYQWLKRQGFPKGFRVLCMNCNTSIGFHGYCPHQRTQQ